MQNILDLWNLRVWFDIFNLSILIYSINENLFICFVVVQLKIKMLSYFMRRERTEYRYHIILICPRSSQSPDMFQKLNMCTSSSSCIFYQLQGKLNDSYSSEWRCFYHTHTHTHTHTEHLSRCSSMSIYNMYLCVLRKVKLKICWSKSERNC